MVPLVLPDPSGPLDLLGLSVQPDPPVLRESQDLPEPSALPALLGLRVFQDLSELLGLLDLPEIPGLLALPVPLDPPG